MRSEPALMDAIDKLYAAALAREDWTAVLGHVRDAFAGHHVILATHDFATGQVPFRARAGIEAEHCARVLSEEAWRMAAPIFGNIQLDAALPRGALVSDGDFARSAFYNEILRPARGFHGVGALLRGPGPLMASINICRPQHAGAYDTPDAAALQHMLPHIAMALEVQHRLGAASGRAQCLERLLDQVAVAALLTDALGRPRFVNARADALLAAADGLVLTAAGVAAATPFLTRELRDGIARIASSNGNGAAAIRLRLPRPSLRPALRVTLSPAWHLDPDGATGAAARQVAMLVSEPDAPPPIDREALAGTFRLTARETDVTVLLADGMDLPSIAVALDVGVGTIRFHLKHAFQKTGAPSQAALVALVRGFAGIDRA